MAELDGMQQNGGTSKTVEKFIRSEDPTSRKSAPLALGGFHDQEDDHLHHGKKLSVLAKVKEKAKKWRQAIVKKKFGHGSNHTPSWGVALEDYEVEEEHENVGSLAYESQQAPKSSTDNTGQHQIADPFTFEKHNFDSNVVQSNTDSEMRQKLPALRLRTTKPALVKSHSDHLGGNPSLSGVTIDENPRALSLGNHVRETHDSPSRFTLDTLIAQRSSDKKKEKLPHPEMTVETLLTEENDEPSNANEENRERPYYSPMKATDTDGAESSNATKEQEQQQSPTKKKTITEEMSEKMAPAYATVTEATSNITSKIKKLSMTSPGEEQNWDKGVSVKEYLKNKLEPGEDERALSQVITEVISPRRSPTEKGVAEKVKTAVSMLLQTGEPSSPTSMKISRSSSQIPVSTNAHEVDEENQGGAPQAK